MNVSPGILSAPSSTGRPTTPFMPTTPTSTVLPSFMGKTTEASPSSRKNAYSALPSSSCVLNFRVTGERWGLRRSIWDFGRAAKTRFLYGCLGGCPIRLLRGLFRPHLDGAKDQPYWGREEM